MLGGWELSGIATFKDGIPLGLFGNDQPTFGGNPRPDVIANPKLSKRTLNEWFNTGAFQFAAYGSFGTAPRFFSNLRSPGYQDWDTALEKNWIFHETMRAQFRFETFNTFNHPQFYAPAHILLRMRSQCRLWMRQHPWANHQYLPLESCPMGWKILLVTAV